MPWMMGVDRRPGKRSLSVGVGLGLVITLQAMPCQAETLAEFLAATYEQNNSLGASRAQLRSADEGVSLAEATWRPTVTIGTDVGRQDLNSNVVPAYHMYNTTQDATAKIVQPLYQGGLESASVGQAENIVLAQRANLKATEANVLLAAATAFFDVERDSEILQINIENEQTLRRQAEAAHERFREGEVSSTDVAQSEARFSQASALRELAEGALANSRSSFLAAVGHFPEKLEMSPELLVTPAQLNDVHAATLRHNPGILAAVYTFEAAKKGVDVAFAALLPQLQVSVQRQTYWNSTYTPGDSRTDQVVLTLSVPLFQQGAEYAKVRGQKETVGQRHLEADQAKLTALQTADLAWNSLKSNSRAQSFYQEQVSYNQNALVGVQEEEQIGSRTVLDVLNAKQELFNSRISLVQTRHDVLASTFQVRAIIGDLTAETLALPVELYDPTKHYDAVRDKWLGLGDDIEK